MLNHPLQQLQMAQLWPQSLLPFVQILVDQAKPACTPHPAYNGRLYETNVIQILNKDKCLFITKTITHTVILLKGIKNNKEIYNLDTIRILFINYESLDILMIYFVIYQLRLLWFILLLNSPINRTLKAFDVYLNTWILLQVLF